MSSFNPNNSRAHDATLYPKKKIWSESQQVQFKIADFSRCAERFGEYIETTTESAHGLPWVLRIFPCECSLPLGRKRVVKAHFVLDTTLSHPVSTTMMFKIPGIENDINASHNYFGTGDVCRNISFAERDKIVAACLEDNNEDVLVVSVTIRIGVEKPIWFPKKFKSEPTLAKLFDCSGTGDVFFEVGDEEFEIHRCLLAVKAPELFPLVKDLPYQAKLPLPGIRKDVFAVVHKYIYGVKQDIKKQGLVFTKCLLSASNQFGCTQLKLHAESSLALNVDASSLAEMLLFADSHCCALLKEICLDVFAADPKSVMASQGWKLIAQSTDLLLELLEFYALTSKNLLHLIPNKDSDVIGTMDVASLRTMLDKAGLDLDGTKQTLVKRLDSHVNSVDKVKSSKSTS